MTCIAIKDGRGETRYCAIVWAMKGGGGGGGPNKGGVGGAWSGFFYKGLALKEYLVKAKSRPATRDSGIDLYTILPLRILYGAWHIRVWSEGNPTLLNIECGQNTG